MPSGHTTAAFAMAVLLACRWPRFTAAWFIIAAGVGVSRSLLDRHFPSDVVVGSCPGTFTSMVLWNVLIAFEGSLTPTSNCSSKTPG
jgi:undecaprenyl-diphosphatase